MTHAQQATSDPRRTSAATQPSPASCVTAPLVVRTVEIADPGPLLSLLPTGPIAAWVRRGEGLVGFGVAARLQLPATVSDGSLSEAWAGLTRRAVVRDDVKLPGTGCVGFVSAPFAPDSPAGSVIVAPQTIVGHREGRWWLTRSARGNELPRLHAVASQPAARNSPGSVRYADGALSGPVWMERVSAAVRRVNAGGVDKVVLARDLEARCDEPVDPRWLLDRLSDRYPGCWTFWVDSLVGATPELLVRCERGLVTSRVLAGTVGRTGHDAEDLAHAASLARSSKDLEEHEYAVRSVADALAPHCASMNVPETPFVLHLPNVMHLATDVTGVLLGAERNRRGGVLDLAAALHPSAAVCGTPTQAAAELIAELELMDRDRYAGPVGWVDAQGDGELGIALRCGRVDQSDPRRVRLFAGCGIVSGSDPAAELAESDAKLVPMRDALG